MSTSFTVGKHRVGQNEPTYFVADIAANHDGDLARAVDLVHLCAEAGANAAKFQNFLAKTIVSDVGFRSLGTQASHQAAWKKSVYEVYEDASLPMEWTLTLKKACAEAGVDYFTSPYDLELVDILEEHVCAWKLGSGDITWPTMIDRLASGGLPLFLATGATTLEEVQLAMRTALAKTSDLVLMQCNTNYTNSPENFRHINLNVLQTYAKAYPDVVLGLSDHTEGHATVLGAVALGARAIEKHFTDDRSRTGPDHAFAMDPVSWREMVERTRELEAALGDGIKRLEDNERETVVLQRRAIRAARDLPQGTVLTLEDLEVLRPCPEGALPPYRMGELLDRTLANSISAGNVVHLDDVE